MKVFTHHVRGDSRLKEFVECSGERVERGRHLDRAVGEVDVETGHGEQIGDAFERRVVRLSVNRDEFYKSINARREQEVRSSRGVAFSSSSECS